MKKAHSREKTRYTDGMPSTNSSVTVERSYEVSDDYSNTKPSQAPESVSSFHRRDKTPSMLNLSSTYRAETSIGRPSSARESCQPSLHHEHPICPSPIVRSSQEHLHIHEALRSPFPVFRQSRRWAKTYLGKDDGRPATSPAEWPRRQRHTTAPDMSRHTQIEEVPRVAGMDDDDPEHYGLCRPAHLPGWQTFKNHRLHTSHSMSSTRVVKATGVKGPRRIRSFMSIRSRFKTSPRPVMLKPVQSERKHQEYQELFHESPSRRPKHRQSQSLPRSLNSPVSSLHDFRKLKRFSQECAAILSGLDFGDEWRLSTIGPSLYVRHEPSVEKLAGKAPVLQQSPSAHSASSSRNRQNPATDASHQIMDTPASLFQEQGPQFAHKVASNLATTVDSNAVRHDPTTSSVTYVEPSTASPDEKMTEAMIQNLKNARSVDTLTEIEAQFASSPSRPVSHESKAKTSIYTQSSSPRHIKQSGNPPERPLPALPNGDTNHKRSASYTRPSRASSYQSKIIHDTAGLCDPCGADLGTVGIDAPFLATSTHSTDSGSVDAEQTGSNFARMITRLHSASSRSQSNTSKANIFVTSSGVTEVGSRRKSKIQEIKKRHIADTYKAHGGTKALDDTDKENHVVDRVNLTQKLHALGTAERGGTSKVKCGTEHVTEINKATQELVPSSTSKTNPNLSSTSAISNHLSDISHHSRVINESAWSLPRSDSSLQGKPSKPLESKSVILLPKPQQWTTNTSALSQPLSRSQIMVVVDTDPHTASFRAGALSPSLSTRITGSRPTTANGRPMTASSRRANSDSRPTTPASRKSTRKAAKVVLKKPDGSESSPSIRANRPVSVPRRDSSKTLRLQAISSRSPSGNETRKVSEYTAPAANISRCRARASHQYMLNNSDSETEQGTMMKKRETTVPSQARNGSRTNLQKSQKHRITPLTAMLEEEVCRVDQELDNVKKQEKRIEHQQQYLEQTLRVWDQMSQTGKRRVLTAILGTTERPGSVKTREANNGKMSPTASTSIYSTRLSVQMMNETLTKSLNNTRASTQRLPDESRRVSATSTSPSTATAAHTDTDTDTFSEAADGVLVKRASDGSLTNPQDYDLSPYSRIPGIASADKKTNSEHLDTSIEDLHVRLQALRSPSIAARRPSTLTSWPKSQHSSIAKKPSSTSIAGAKTPPIICLHSPTDRLAVAPWEAHDDAVKSRVTIDRRSGSGGSGSGSGSENSNSRAEGNSHSPNSYLLDLQQEGLRTDQMDAMIAL